MRLNLHPISSISPAHTQQLAIQHRSTFSTLVSRLHENKSWDRLIVSL
ncbi:Protein of unknown function [Pyronema omphalodes CBS 100304]|uniref:Uncharacterized protein n=1 Tax=Pyronema omphalodes (strain CBS 100304) TaxID=1076935 RepID=U4LDE2_PYROM|nr:Protein of unknown function [Pyronema omphalodes CBS 100304]